MIDLYFCSPYTLAFMRRGVAALHLETFAKELHDEGYGRLAGQRLLHVARHVGEWSARQRLLLEHLDERALARFNAHLPGCRCIRSTRRAHRGLVEHPAGARRFLRHLRRVSVAPAAPTRTRPSWVVEYAAWMRDHRGLTDTTIAAQLPVVEALLAAAGDDATRLDAACVRRFVLTSVAGHAPRKPSSVTTPVRGYLRYLVARGRCAATLLGAVPTIPSWHQTRLPQYIAADDVERVIVAVNREGVAATRDRDGRAAVRDRAVLLLLARLGVRSGDVRELRMRDLDWKRGRVRLTGKGRRETHLPLPQDVGDAILAYLAKRPAAVTDHVFLGLRAPFHPVTSAGVGRVVRSAITRSGVTAPSHGAYLLRHSLASRMLRDGATLDTIGAVLRHRNIDTTAIYAKVDVAHLRQIAQPWPGTEVSSC
jgi:site-specific recombinase XerD